MNVIVLDAGTSSMRGSVCNEKGEFLFVRQIKYSSCHGPDGMVEQPPEDFENGLKTILTEIAGFLKTTGNKPEAITLTAQRSSVIPVDKHGKPLCRTIMWQDTRNEGICRELKAQEETIFRLSGASVNTVFSGEKMRWLKKEHDDIFRKAYKLINIPEYLMYLMTGNFCTDYTYGSRSHLMNLRTRSWDEELLGIFGIPEGMLCELHAPGSVIGYLERDMALATGLPEGLPVITAGGDQQCAAAGQGVLKEETASIVLGTGAYLITMCDGVPDNFSKSMICNCAAVPGKYVLEANVLTCGCAFDWFLREFYDWDGEIDYQKIFRSLEEEYQRDTECVVLPYFQGRSTPHWNPLARAVFGSISLQSGRNDFLKALLEGIFMEINNNIEQMRRYSPITRAFISGGLTRGAIINQIQADIYRIPLQKAKNEETTSLGALLVTLYSLGEIQALEEGFLKIAQSDFERYEPKPEKVAIYTKKREQMNQFYKKIYE